MFLFFLLNFNLKIDIDIFQCTGPDSFDPW